LPALDAFKNGLVEVQDEGSQIAALLVDAKPGQTVADYCAGAGGKTLALAAAMDNRGRIVACDIDRTRLRHIGARLARAGVSIVETAVLDGEGRAAALAEGGFDRVLVDAPCSGTGVWRRAPDARWRLAPADLGRHVERQRAILAESARLPAKRGWLVYVTCSLLQEENERQIEQFLGNHSEFEILPFNDVWPDTTTVAALGDGPFLRLSPGRHGTDGFFVAVLERR
jgi:16S rRNA (cytosine967-C5)-methyltransferase